MRLRRLHLTGFGHFSDVDLPANGTGLSERLTVIHGPNEAGKSTILDFIRTLMFGFEHRERAHHFPPLAGGRHGGRLEILDDEERAYILEFYAGRGVDNPTISAEDGRSVEPMALQRVLGHASKEFFNNIFAFDLDQLSSTIKALRDAGVTDSIYSAGVGAAGLTQALTQFNSSLLQIYRPTGKKQPVAQALSALATVEKELAESAALAGQYGKLQSEREATDQALVEANTSRVLARKECARAERLRKAWPDWVTLRELERELAKLPPRPEFPNDAPIRLENVETTLVRVSTRLEKSRAELSRCRSAAAAEKFNSDLLDDEAEIETLRRKRDAFSGSLEDLPERRVEVQELEQEVEQDVRALGRAWNADRVDRFDMSEPVRKELAELGDAHGAALQAVREVEVVRESADRASVSGEEAVEAARQALRESPDIILDADTLRARRTATNRLREEWVRLEAARTTHEQECARLVELQTRRPEAQPAPFWQRTEWVGAAATAGAGALALVGGIVAGGAGLIFGIVAAVLLAATAIFLAWRARKAPVPLAWGQLNKAIAAQTKHKAETAEALEAMETQLPDLAAEANAGEVEAMSDVAAAEELLDEAQEVLDTRRAREEALRAAQLSLQSAQEETKRAQAASAQASASAEEARRAWSIWLDSHELAETLQPEEVTELFGRLETMRAKLSQLADRRRRGAAIKNDIEEFCSLATPLLLKHRKDALHPTEAQVGPAVDTLISAFDASRAARERKEHLDEQAAAARRRLADVTAEHERAEKELQNLLSSAGVEDTIDYRRVTAEQARRTELDARARACTRGLSLLSGPGKALSEFRAALEVANPDSLKQDVERTTLRLDDQEKRRDQLTARLAELKLKLSTLESDSHAAELRERREVLQSELDAQAREWSTLTLAKALLEQTRRRYEEERQPAVVRRAEAYFGRITGGRYPKLSVPLDQQQIEIIQDDGEHKTTDQLSRGTQEQLYLSLRFGLIEEFASRSARLPVIVDDILVNFDPERAERTADALRQLARSNQVLVFTCHPSTVELFQRVAPEVETVELPARNS